MTGRRRLRLATEADREFLFGLHRDALGEYVDAVWGWWDEDVQRDFFDRRWDDPPMQVIEVDGERVGTMSVVERPDELVLSNIEIAPQWQGQGLGTELLRHLRMRATATGRSLALQVLKVNLRARRLYEREGLHVVGETETHVLMRWPG